MAEDNKLPADGPIRFFGRMTASATHEIKNSLAIINESAGLMEDLVLMAEKGIPLSHERVNDISQRVARQVQRADQVLNKLNRFSHSVDKSTQVSDLQQTVLAVLNLSSRLIEMQEAVFEVSPASSSPMKVFTSLFYLENIIWRAIESACSAAVGEKKIGISFGTDSKAPSIFFSMNKKKDGGLDHLFDSDEDRALIAHLDITIEKNVNGFGLLWPKQI